MKDIGKTWWLLFVIGGLLGGFIGVGAIEWLGSWDGWAILFFGLLGVEAAVGAWLLWTRGEGG